MQIETKGEQGEIFLDKIDFKPKMVTRDRKSLNYDNGIN